ncbi:lytic murein transglycosylase [Micromonospora sp. LOL_024]
MADGEERTTVRPLRPATPPTSPGVDPVGPTTGVPRQRRPPRGSGVPARTGAGTRAGAGTGTVPTTATATAATETASTTSMPDGSEPDSCTTADASPPARHRRVSFVPAVRLPGPRAVARATRDWSRRPNGRLALPGVFLLALVATTAVAGALLVPATLGAPRSVAADASTGTTAEVPGGLPPSGTAPPFGDLPPPTATLPPGATPTGVPDGTTPVGGRPSDSLAGWARQVGTKVGIDPVAMQAYGYAELVLAETNASCTLSWTTLAAIGLVESRHGQANNAQLGADGRAVPEIIGLPLDGQGGRMRIADTDRGEMDRDTTYDRAVGPMQFIPTTWQEIGADADNDGRRDPHNIHDAALAAGMYLCKGGRNLTIPGDWWNAILSYNDVRRYAQEVFDAANRYGQASRT